MATVASERELQETYEYLLEEASKVLELGGSFAPFGAAIREGGEHTHVNVDLAIDRSTPNDHISALIMGFRKEAGDGRIYVAGIAFDGRMTVDGKAVTALVFHIEHAQGQGVQIFVPYQRNDGGPIGYGTPIIEPIVTEIFAPAT